MKRITNSQDLEMSRTGEKVAVLGAGGYLVRNESSRSRVMLINPTSWSQISFWDIAIPRGDFNRAKPKLNILSKYGEDLDRFEKYGQILEQLGFKDYRDISNSISELRKYRRAGLARVAEMAGVSVR